MILADTSVWIGHFRDADQELIQRLSNHEICVHPFIVGEIALGSLSNRKLTLSYLKGMPSSPLAEHEDILRMIEARSLFSLGIGYVDAHLLASCLLDQNIKLWTRDRRLASVAEEMRIAV